MISIRAQKILGTRKRTKYLVVVAIAVAAATVHQFGKFPRPNSYPTLVHFFFCRRRRFSLLPLMLLPPAALKIELKYNRIDFIYGRSTYTVIQCRCLYT